MRLVSHDIDPNGDVVLVLDSSNTALGNDESLEIITVKDIEDVTNNQEEAERDEEKNTRCTQDPSDSKEPVSSGQVFFGFDNGTGQSLRHASGFDGDYECGIRDIKLRVSSRHLILASPVFKSLLEGSFREGTTLSSTGSVDVYLPDDYPEGLLFLMYLIHGQFRKMPRIITPQLLMQVVLLVDKYLLHQNVEPFSDKWIRDVNALMPREMQPDLMHWITVCSVLHCREQFFNLAKIALRTSPHKAPSDNLPITKIVDILEAHKHDALHAAFRGLEDLLDKYIRTKTGGSICIMDKTHFPLGSTNCDELVLGSLIKRLTIAGLYPLPKPPYVGREIKEVYDKLIAINIQTLCEQLPRMFAYNPGKCRSRPSERLAEIANVLWACAGAEHDLHKLTSDWN